MNPEAKLYDVWLIDTITELLTKVDEELEEHEAIDWWREWNRTPQSCICVVAPRCVEMPQKLRLSR